jgi:glyoxylase-like metal-dependent hydrolase (beta-lactamase superfamily II)
MTNTLTRRHFLIAGAIGVVSAARQPAAQQGAKRQVVHDADGAEVTVVSDGHFFLPTGFLLTPDAPAAERDAVLEAAGPAADQFRMPNNVAVIRTGSDLILVDAGTGPRHQPTAGQLSRNLSAAGIAPSAVTKLVLTHAHPDHLWGVLDADDKLTYPNATYVISAREWDAWSRTDLLRTLPPALANDRIVSGVAKHLAGIKDRMRMVGDGDEIAKGVSVIDTPGHTPGHVSIEVRGLVIGGDAFTHPVISFAYPSWRVPVDHEADRGVETRKRLLDRLAADRVRILGAHLPPPGVGFVERYRGAFRFVAA